jgi:hypothetical protein
MRMVLIAAGLALALGTTAHARVPSGLAADALHEFAPSDVQHVKKDKYKYKWKGNGCKYEFKADHKGFKEKYKCK